jgi:hypothetical protein
MRRRMLRLNDLHPPLSCPIMWIVLHRSRSRCCGTWYVDAHAFGGEVKLNL